MDANAETVEGGEQRMTNSEAIKILQGDFSGITPCEGQTHSDLFAKAFDMAIEALKKKDTSGFEGKKIYISGKMAGLSDDEIRRNFSHAEYMLREKGAIPINPTKFNLACVNMGYEEILRMDFKMIDLCDGIFLIDNWTDSGGAKRERAYAIAMGKKIYEEDEDGNVIEV